MYNLHKFQLLQTKREIKRKSKSRVKWTKKSKSAFEFNFASWLNVLKIHPAQVEILRILLWAQFGLSFGTNCLSMSREILFILQKQQRRLLFCICGRRGIHSETKSVVAPLAK